jgi:hypothetical protein
MPGASWSAAGSGAPRRFAKVARRSTGWSGRAENPICLARVYSGAEVSHDIVLIDWAISAKRRGHAGFGGGAQAASRGSPAVTRADEHRPEPPGAWTMSWLTLASCLGRAGDSCATHRCSTGSRRRLDHVVHSLPDRDRSLGRRAWRWRRCGGPGRPALLDNRCRQAKKLNRNTQILM